MPGHMKTRRTKTRSSPQRKKGESNSFIPWREVYKEEIEAFSEGGLMLRGSRSKESITQKELAEQIGVSQHHISEMENGRRPIGKEMAKRFAAFFKTDYRIFL